MGDRALVQFIDSEGATSPVIYLHWAGNQVPKLLDKHDELMKNRKGDLQYSAARFIGICHAEDVSDTSLGVWNQAEKLTPEDSHGDAGCIVVNVDTFEREYFGGYLGKDEAA